MPPYKLLLIINKESHGLQELISETSSETLVVCVADTFQLTSNLNNDMKDVKNTVAELVKNGAENVNAVIAGVYPTKSASRVGIRIDKAVKQMVRESPESLTYTEGESNLVFMSVGEIVAAILESNPQYSYMSTMIRSDFMFLSRILAGGTIKFVVEAVATGEIHQYPFGDSDTNTTAMLHDTFVYTPYNVTLADQALRFIDLVDAQIIAGAISAASVRKNTIAKPTREEILSED